MQAVFSTHRLCKYKLRDADLGSDLPDQPPPVLMDDAGTGLFEIERIIAEQPCKWQGEHTVRYLVRWRDWPPSYDSWCEHPWFSKEQGGPMAIEAWHARQRSIPVPASRDRAACHRNKRPVVPVANPAAAPVPAPVPPAVPVPAPVAVPQGRPQRVKRARVQFDNSDRRDS